MAPSHRSWPTRGTGLRLSREAIDDARVRRLDIAHLSHIVMNGWSYLTVHITGASSPQLNKSTHPDPCAQRGWRSLGTPNEQKGFGRHSVRGTSPTALLSPRSHLRCARELLERLLAP